MTAVLNPTNHPTVRKAINTSELHLTNDNRLAASVRQNVRPARRRAAGRLLKLPAVASALFSSTTLLVGQGTAFTYQGQLQSSGSPANGTYNLTFSLYATNSSGAPVAGPVTNSAVKITNGLFTVIIDFGSGAWNGAANWLEIGVETNGGGAFTVLTPRQELTPAPYAIAAGRLLGAVAAGNTVADLLNGPEIGIGQTYAVVPAVLPTNVNQLLYLPSGQGLVRSVWFAWSSQITASSWLRVYPDCGMVANTTNLVLSTAGAAVNAWIPEMIVGGPHGGWPGNDPGLMALSTSLLDSQTEGQYFINLKIPMPFTNGICIGIADTNTSTVIYPYSFVSYQTGSITNYWWAKWRLCATNAMSTAWNGAIQLLNVAGSGALLMQIVSANMIPNGGGAWSNGLGPWENGFDYHHDGVDDHLFAEDTFYSIYEFSLIANWPPSNPMRPLWHDAGMIDYNPQDSTHHWIQAVRCWPKNQITWENGCVGTKADSGYSSSNWNADFQTWYYSSQGR